MAVKISFDISAFALTRDEYIGFLETAPYVETDDYLSGDSAGPDVLADDFIVPSALEFEYSGFENDDSAISSAIFRIRAYAENGARLARYLTDIIGERETALNNGVFVSDDDALNRVAERERAIAIKALIESSNYAARTTGFNISSITGGR